MDVYTVMDFAFDFMDGGTVATCNHCGRHRWAGYSDKHSEVTKRAAWIGIMHTDACALIRASEQSVRK